MSVALNLTKKPFTFSAKAPEFNPGQLQATFSAAPQNRFSYAAQVRLPMPPISSSTTPHGIHFMPGPPVPPFFPQARFVQAAAIPGAFPIIATAHVALVPVNSLVAVSKMPITQAYASPVVHSLPEQSQAPSVPSSELVLRSSPVEKVDHTPQKPPLLKRYVRFAVPKKDSSSSDAVRAKRPPSRKTKQLYKRADSAPLSAAVKKEHTKSKSLLFTKAVDDISVRPTPQNVGRSVSQTKDIDEKASPHMPSPSQKVNPYRVSGQSSAREDDGKPVSIEFQMGKAKEFMMIAKSNLEISDFLEASACYKKAADLFNALRIRGEKQLVIDFKKVTITSMMVHCLQSALQYHPKVLTHDSQEILHHDFAFICLELGMAHSMNCVGQTEKEGEIQLRLAISCFSECHKFDILASLEAQYGKETAEKILKKYRFESYWNQAQCAMQLNIYDMAEFAYTEAIDYCTNVSNGLFINQQLDKIDVLLGRKSPVDPINDID